MATAKRPSGGTNRSKGPAPRKQSSRTKGPIGPAPGLNASAAENKAYTKRAADRGFAVYKTTSPSGQIGWAGEKKAAPRSANYKGPSTSKGRPKK